MPFPAEHMLAQWTAQRGTTEEIVVGSMRFALTGADPAADAIRLVDTDNAGEQVLAKLRAFWQDETTFIPETAILREFRWNRVGTDGRYVADTTRLIDGLNVVGSRPGQAMPFQIAWATTWTTGVTRGLAHFGRTYWPTNMGIDPADGRVPLAQTTPMAARCAALIGQWANWTGIDQTSAAPVIGSRNGAGVFRAITGCKQGRVLDTMRTRRGQLDEDYQAAQTAF